jgi:hypothetical protein
MWFKSGEKPDNLYGEDVYAAVIDEASRLRPESFHAVRSTLTFTGGPVRCIGNVKGRKNWFYELCRKAEHGEPGYSYHKMTAYDAVAGGVFPESEIEDAKRACPRTCSANCTSPSQRRRRQPVRPVGHPRLHRPNERRDAVRDGRRLRQVD